MISILGFLAVYFSIRKPTEDERQGARPPAVRIATFAYGMHTLGSFRAARFAREGARSIVLARFAREGAWSSVCVVRVRRGRGGGVGGPRWRRSGRASAGLPPHTRRRHAPPVPRVHGCQQRWNGQRGRANGASDAQRPRLGMLSFLLPYRSMGGRGSTNQPAAKRSAAQGSYQGFLTCFGGL